LTSFFNW